MRPSLEQLRHLVALDETRHFTRAAARCHIAQPPFSRSIRRLEEIVGVALVSRERGAIGLTPAGRTLAGRARDILAALDDALRAAQADAAGRRRLRIGLVEYAYSLIAPTGLDAFAQTVPDYSIEPLDQPDHQPDAALLSGALDMAFAAVSSPDTTAWPEGVNATPIITEPLAAIVSRDHRLAEADAAPLGEIAGERLIAFARNHAPTVYDAAVEALAADGASPRVELEVEMLQTMLNGVRSLNGVGLAPLSVRSHDLPDVTVVPLSGARVPAVSLILLWLAAEEQPVFRSFAEWMRENIRTGSSEAA
ncbi:LysR family transcriptional regulator [Ectothiorhodospiraceae bacterium WFHF3C12]|nr:LysR family transcriptional regulator [Ectothiorhodospiraceae bacterium WFHF3C12]